MGILQDRSILPLPPRLLCPEYIASKEVQIRVWSVEAMRKVKAWRKGIISAALLLSLGATGLFARDKGSAAAIRQVSAQERTVTGCLRQGTEQGSFDLMADDGTVW